MLRIARPWILAWTAIGALLVSGCGSRSSDCVFTCGDGVQECDEACDDGNSDDGDGCSADCRLEDCSDADADGVTTCQGDCDDAAAEVHPGAAEVGCNGVDDDCDPATADLQDADADGVSCILDCDDSDPGRSPAQGEVVCNGLDDDCDPATADDPNSDGDPVGLCGGDCDDTDPAIHPGATELCSAGVDEDCDGAIDCNDPDCSGEPACTGGDCAGPILLAGTGAYSFSTAGQPNGHSGTCQPSDGGEVIFRIDLAADTDLHADTRGSDYDTVLYLRQADCAAGAELLCSDDVNQRVSWARIELSGLPAGTYFLFVDSALPSDGGQLELNLVLSPTVVDPPLAVAADPLVRMPGTQPAQGITVESPNRCLNCHADYDLAVEPGHNWKGSMMAQAARDFLFFAAYTVAIQDSYWALGTPNAGDLCERCHFPGGWLGGRSDPPNASLMRAEDFDGVHCDLCHRQFGADFADTYAGTREGSDWQGYWDETGASGTPSQAEADTTLAADQDGAGTILFFNGLPFFGGDHRPVEAGYTEATSGQYYIGPSGAKRASFADATGRHEQLYSRFHKSRYMCATCHDVSNPALANLAMAGTQPGDGSSLLPSETQPAAAYFHVERTFSEFMLSAYGQQGGAAGVGPYAPGVFETSLANDYIARCQDCHMPDGQLSFRVVNQTGHKLLSGFPEGRRMFVNVQAYSGGSRIWEVNPYDPVVATLKGLPASEAPDSPDLGPAEEHIDELVYQMHPSSVLTGEEKTLHFVLATGRYKDNRIPPKGFDIDAAAARHCQPVWQGVDAPGYFTPDEYAGGYDQVDISLPPGADRVEVRLYYQTTSREYVTFLREQINGAGVSLPSPTGTARAVAYRAQLDPFFDRVAAWGDTIWQLWEHNKDLPGAAPVVMTEATWTP